MVLPELSQWHWHIQHTKQSTTFYACGVRANKRRTARRKEKTDSLNRFAQQVELQVNPIKTEVWPLNISAPLPIKIGQLNLKTTQQFTYVGRTICSDGGLTWTSGRGLVRLEGPLQSYDPCGGAENTAGERRLRSTKLVQSPYY